MSNGCTAAIGPFTTDSCPPDTRTFTANVFSTTETQATREMRSYSWMAFLEDIEATSRITRYLSLRGAEQRAERQSLVKWFNTSRSPQRHVETILKLIEHRPTESRLEAAIDLLTLLGSTVVNLAVQRAESGRRNDSNATYALATAAARIESSLIWLFVRSSSDVFREAVINLVDDLPSEEGMPLLRQLALDSNPSVRHLATLALSD